LALDANCHVHLDRSRALVIRNFRWRPTSRACTPEVMWVGGRVGSYVRFMIFNIEPLSKFHSTAAYFIYCCYRVAFKWFSNGSDGYVEWT
jgi:hypothetical protein